MSTVYDPENTPLEGMMLLEASAGTGKTYALERMVARLVAREDDPLDIGSILVVTFTNRAAREMKERIRRLLSDRSRDDRHSGRERSRYLLAMSQFDRAPIYTIHGFCQMVLATWPFESDSPFGQDLEPGGPLEEAETRAWLAGMKPEELEDPLLRNAYVSAGSVEELTAAIVAELSNDRIPPGSQILPNTEDLERFARLCVSSRDPESPMNTAARALLQREWSDEGMNGLFRASGMKRGKAAKSLDLIRSHLIACRGGSGLEDLAERLFGDPARVGVKAHFKELFRAAVDNRQGRSASPENVEPGSESEELAEGLHNLFCEMEPYLGISDTSSGPMESLVDRYMWRAFLARAVSELKPRVEIRKDREGRWGYADLIHRVAQAVTMEDSKLRRLLRSRFRAALIDEFQDTDPRQWQLFQELFGRAPHFLALIGDPKQSIYGFRGTGLQAYKRARAGVSSSYRLDTNYRSTAPLVEAVNRLFHPLFSSGCLDNPPVGFTAVGSGKETVPETEDLPPIRLLSAPPVPAARGGINRSAADTVSREIRCLLDTRPSVQASDVAVLVRGAKQESAVLDSLRDAGLPAVLIRSRSVFGQPAAEPLIGLLRALERPGDISRWKAVLLSAFFDLPAPLLVEFEEKGLLDEFVEKGGLWREELMAGRTAGVLDEFFSFSTAVAGWAAKSGRDDVAEILGRPWPRRLLAGTEGERHWQDWNHLCDLVQGKQAEGVREPADLVLWLTRSAESADPDGREDAVRLETESPAVRVLTMHASKGLEFPYVFVIGAFTGKSSRGMADDYRFDRDGRLHVDLVRSDRNWKTHLAYDWEESKRLWYVACTRASSRLWMILPEDGAFTGVESLLSESVGLSSPDRLPPHERLDKQGSLELREILRRSLADLAAEESPILDVAAGDDVPGGPPQGMSGGLRRAVEDAGLLRTAPLPSLPAAIRDPVTSSYTSLTRGIHQADITGERDVDRHTGESVLSPAGEPEEDPVPLAADRGALFGTLVHALFEEIEFTDAAGSESDWFEDPEIDDIFRTQAGRFYRPDWYPARSAALKKMVRDTLRAPVPGLGPLCRLGSGQMRTEAEFLISLPEEAPAGSQDPGIPAGFLKGFIDLLVLAGGRWWVLDWKTNVPHGAASAAGYSSSGVAGMMDQHRYHLQYELYLLSLCRSLAAARGTPVDWESEIGGAVYLFIRGTRESDDRGIFTSKPDKERMLQLARSSSLEGVLE